MSRAVTPRRLRVGATAGRVLAAGLLTTLLGACSLNPARTTPSLPVAERFPGAGESDGRHAGDIAWQEFFADARLKKLIETGLANNRDLRVAALNIDRARALYQIQRADEFPTVNVSGQRTRQRLPSSATPTGFGFLSSYYQLGIGLTSYELDFFGRIRSLSQAALASYLATDEGWRSSRISLVASIAEAYLTLTADDALLALTERTLASREESLRLSKLRFDAGVAAESDLRQAQTLLESARAARSQFARQRAQDENALNLLVGETRPIELPGAQAFDAQRLLADIPVGLPSDLLTRRPDIRAAEHRLIGADANIGAARAAFFPRITLTATLGSASRELGDLFGAGTGAWSFIPGLSLPIFDGGRNRAGRDVAEVDRKIAVADYERTIQTAFREVADGLAGRATLGDQIKALQAQADAESARVRLAEMRYKGGVASFLDLLDAQRSLYSVQQSVIQTQLLEFQNRVRLYKALGGGWTPGTPPAASR